MGDWVSEHACSLPIIKKGAIIMTNTDLGVHQMKGIIGEIYHSIFGNDY